MVHLKKVIGVAKERLLKEKTLDAYYYKYVRREQPRVVDVDAFDGETISQVAYKAFIGEYVQLEQLSEAIGATQKSKTAKYLTVYQMIGIGLQANMQENRDYQTTLADYFSNHSIERQYLITKCVTTYKSELIKNLKIAALQKEEQLPLKEKILHAVLVDKRVDVDELLPGEIHNVDIDIPMLLILEELVNFMEHAYQDKSGSFTSKYIPVQKNINNGKISDVGSVHFGDIHNHYHSSNEKDKNDNNL